MNASAVRDKKNGSPKLFNNASDKRENPHTINNNVNNNEKPKTTKEFNEKLYNEPDIISIDDVLYGDYSKPKTNTPVLRFDDIHDEDKPNKKNFKILRKFLRQEADIINKSDF